MRMYSSSQTSFGFSGCFLYPFHWLQSHYGSSGMVPGGESWDTRPKSAFLHLHEHSPCSGVVARHVGTLGDYTQTIVQCFICKPGMLPTGSQSSRLKHLLSGYHMPLSVAKRRCNVSIFGPTDRNWHQSQIALVANPTPISSSTKSCLLAQVPRLPLNRPCTLVARRERICVVCTNIGKMIVQIHPHACERNNVTATTHSILP